MEEKYKLLIDSILENEIKIALVNEENKLIEYKPTKIGDSIIGNIYLGKIDRIEQSIEAVFVNMGNGLKGFVSFCDIHEQYWEITKTKKRHLKKNQILMLQVIKDANNNKLCKLTTFVSLVGLNCVFLPNTTNNCGISKKITGKHKILIKEFLAQLGLQHSLIIRTSSKFCSLEEIKLDFDTLNNLWKNILQKSKNRKIGPLYQVDKLLSILRNYSKHQISEVIIGDKEIYKKVINYYKSRLVIYPEDIYLNENNIFASVQKQIDNLYGTEIPLDSGGSIIIEQTQALISIDVNSGNYFKEKNMEQTGFNINKEATIAIYNQIILRNLGGLIVIDFIDMKDEENIQSLNALIKKQFKDDKAATKILGFNQFGIVQISRQRIGKNIAEQQYVKCTNCTNGNIKDSYYSALELIERIKDAAFNIKQINTSPTIMQILLNDFNLISKNLITKLNLSNVKWNFIDQSNPLFNTCTLKNSN